LLVALWAISETQQALIFSVRMRLGSSVRIEA
jgi:hypothetical protein